ncbi:MAG: hypothetical protein QM500_14990 [Methylococcales bacterium]
MNKRDYILFTPAIAHALPKNTKLNIFYDDFNVGRFKMIFDEISDVSDYAYEFMGAICRGSGAERCFITNEDILTLLPDTVPIQRYRNSPCRR